MMTTTRRRTSANMILFAIVGIMWLMLGTTSTAAWMAAVPQTAVHRPAERQRRNHLHVAVAAAPLDRRSSTWLATTKDDTQTATKTTTTMLSLNPLLDEIQPSQTVEIFSKVKQMQAQGEDVVASLCVGEPDFAPFESILEAASTAMLQNGQTRYTALTGTIELRTAIANYLETRKHVTYDPQTEILVGNGAKQNVFQALLAVAGRGDAVLVPAPYWPSYPEQVRLCHAQPVIVETQASDGYLLTPDALRKTLQQHENIKCFILCNPSNPTGSVYTKSQLQDLVDVLRDFPQVVVVADEIYERLVYDDEQLSTGSVCFASLGEDMRNRTVVINGFSKAYAMTGFRLGYSAAPAYLTRAMSTIQSQLTSCAGSISQASGVAALSDDGNETELQQNIRLMRTKRDYVVQRLEKMPQIRLETIPNGAFYVLPSLVGCNDDDDVQFCIDLLDQEGLALVPGSSFGAPGTVRISYATSLEELEVAMDKLERFLGTFAAQEA